MGIVIGLTGRNCAGKDAAADILERHGFERHSLSDALRDELRARGLPITREALIATGNELREAEGPATLAQRMKRKMKTDRVVLVSVRNLAEVSSLGELPNFTLVAVDAPAELRFRREHERNPHRGEGMAPDLDAFLALEAREEGAKATSQQLGATIEAADHRIQNTGTLEDLERAILDIVEGMEDGG
jgi:dephospho-CoA kinase